MGVLRDMFRRKGRTLLTVLGIAIGVFALVVLGSASENDNVYIQNLTGFYANVITVIDSQDANFVGMANGNRPLTMEMRSGLEAYDGVDGVYPQVSTLLEDNYVSIIPPMVLSVTPGMWKDYLGVTLAQGRLINGDEEREVVLGSDIAKGRKLHVGDTITIRGTRFSVVGVLNRTFVNLSDSAVYVPLADAQQLYWNTLPEAYRTGIKPSDLAMEYMVHVAPGADAEALASKIARDFPGTKATGPTEMMETVSGLVNLLNAIVLAVASVALIVCTLSIVNTMQMAVGERTREIGVKRALGATRGRVALDVVAESVLMSGLGGLLGVGAGSIVATALNSAIVASTGTSALLITWRLAAGAFVFAVVLGLLGGLWPARHAARLDPAAALAYE